MFFFKYWSGCIYCLFWGLQEKKNEKSYLMLYIYNQILQICSLHRL